MQVFTLLVLTSQNYRQDARCDALGVPKQPTKYKFLTLFVLSFRNYRQTARVDLFVSSSRNYRQGASFDALGLIILKFHRGEGASFDALGLIILKFHRGEGASFDALGLIILKFHRGEGASFDALGLIILKFHGVDGRDRDRNVGSGNTNRDTSSFSSGSTVRTNHTCSIAVWSHPLTLRWEASVSHPLTSHKVWINVAKPSPTISVRCWHRGEDSAATRTSGG